MYRAGVLESSTTHLAPYEDKKDALIQKNVRDKGWKNGHWPGLLGAEKPSTLEAPVPVDSAYLGVQ